jgi:hypothetical protein
MLWGFRAWSGALTVMLITTVLVVLDVSDRAVRRFWSAHSFTASVLSGLLVLLLTVLIVDRVTRMRQVRGQSRARPVASGGRAAPISPRSRATRRG